MRWRDRALVRGACKLSPPLMGVNCLDENKNRVEQSGDDLKQKSQLYSLELALLLLKAMHQSS